MSLALEGPWTYLLIACYLISEDPLHMAAVCDTLFGPLKGPGLTSTLHLILLARVLLLLLRGPGLTSTLHVILLASILSIWLLYVIHFWTSEGPWTYLQCCGTGTGTGTVGTVTFWLVEPEPEPELDIKLCI